MKGVKGTITRKRICRCGRRKAYNARTCLRCYVPIKPLLGKTGVAHPAWKGGAREIDKDGYVRVYKPSHPWQRGRMIAEHVLVVECWLGRRLRKGECIHHKNGIRTDNRIENLEIMDHAEHSSRHARNRNRSRDATGRFTCN